MAASTQQEGPKRRESRARIQVLELRLYQLELAGQLGRIFGDAWRAGASCRGLDTEAFYPATADAAGVAETQRICRHCPVQVECYGNAETWGIWGGTTEWERADYRRALERRE